MTVFSGHVLAAEAEVGSSLSNAIDTFALKQGLDTVWVLVAAFLVFFMQAGFGMVEAGFIRAKNTCNILTKNFLDFCMASPGFFVVGYALMFGDGNGLFGTKGWCLFGGLMRPPAVCLSTPSGCSRRHSAGLRRR
jgi:Amt family ammonium transporter